MINQELANRIIREIRDTVPAAPAHEDTNNWLLLLCLQNLDRLDREVAWAEDPVIKVKLLDLQHKWATLLQKVSKDEAR